LPDPASGVTWHGAPMPTRARHHSVVRRITCWAAPGPKRQGSKSRAMQLPPGRAVWPW
jgi:hypothetical protein